MQKIKIIQDIVDAEHNVEDVISDVIHETRFQFRPKTIAGRKMRVYIKRSFPNWFGKNYRYIFVVILLLAVGLFSFYKIHDLQTELAATVEERNSFKSIVDKAEESKKLYNQLTGSSFVHIDGITLLNDIEKRFPNISTKAANTIIETIISESKKYDMNPLILYAMGVIESGHRFWIEHDQVYVIVPKENGKGTKRILIRAVGWGGIVWEIHYKMLKAEGIAQTRTDLFYPEANIRAAAKIYNVYFEMDKLPGTKNQDESAQRRYFGGNFKHYSDKINAQVLTLVNAEIYRLNNHKQKEENVK